MPENLLTAQSLSKAWGNKVLFDQLEFGVEAGQKVALLGINGCGKSTLMRVLAGVESDYSGTVTRKKDLRLCYQGQDTHLLPENSGNKLSKSAQNSSVKSVPPRPSVSDSVNPDNNESYSKKLWDVIYENKGKLGKAIIHYLNWQYSGESHTEHTADLETDIENAHGWDLYAEVNSMATQLDMDLSLPIESQLSGGQIKRVQMIKALCGEPDLLLLDEPTNHLDEDCIRWLEGWLKTFRGTLILITHDRYFLERVVNHIIELWRGKAYSYPGNYTRYLEKKAELEEMMAARDQKRLAFLRNEIDWIRRVPKARGTKAKARIQRYDEALNQSGYEKQKALDLDLSSNERMGKLILEMKKVDKAFGDKVLLNKFTLGLRQGERWGLLGANGCGKTTLLRIMMGTEPSDSGHVQLGFTTKIAYFDQHRETLEEHKTVWQNIVDDSEYVQFGSQKINKRSFLEGFLFPSDLQQTQVSRLSGGEKNRLQLAKVMLTPANLLILDEPTNDLDIQSLQVLEEALIAFQGCVLVVSHDRYFLDRVVTGIMAFAGDGEILQLPGNYADNENWRNEWKQRKREAAASESTNKAKAKSLADDSQKIKSNDSSASLEGKKRTALSYLEKKEWDSLEATILSAETQLQQIESELNSASAESNYAKVEDSSKRYSEQKAIVDGMYARWQFLEDKQAS